MKIRTFNVACAHEIVLPNKKTVLIDPYFPGEKAGEKSREAITGADYILMTHTHFDHDLDLAYFVKKFNSKVFISAFSAMDAMKFHQIPYDNIFPIYPGQKYTLEDFTFQVWQAKHNALGGKIFSLDDDITKKECGIEGHFNCDVNGSMDSLDYLITTNNNFRIMIASGQVICNDIFDICKQNGPNLLLRQAGVRRGGDFRTGVQVSATELAQLLIRYRAQIIMPFHMDLMCNRIGEDKVEEYFQEVAVEVSKIDPGALFIYPKEWEWYNISINISIE